MIGEVNNGVMWVKKRGLVVFGKGGFLKFKVPLFKTWDSTFPRPLSRSPQNFSYRAHFFKFRWTFDNQGNFLIISMTLFQNRGNSLISSGSFFQRSGHFFKMLVVILKVGGFLR